MLQVNNLSVTYSNNVHAVEQVSFEIPEGQTVGIIGPNGAGKSSLVKGILNLSDDVSGQVTFGGKPLKEIQSQIAYVEQRNQFDLDFPIHVEDVVLMGTYPKLGWFKRPGAKERKAAIEALEKVEMADLKDRQIGELSGGQLQRVLIARTLVQDANIIFLDEPFVGVDMKSEQIIMNQIKELQAEGKTIIIVHHDLSQVRDFFDYLVLLNRKLVAAGPVSEVFNRQNLEKAYGTDIFFDASEVF